MSRMLPFGKTKAGYAEKQTRRGITEQGTTGRCEGRGGKNKLLCRFSNNDEPEFLPCLKKPRGLGQSPRILVAYFQFENSDSW